MENYIVINGKKAELTKEQLEKLGIEVEKESPFERLPDADYFYIDERGNAFPDKDSNYDFDDARYNVANYCRDEGLMQQRALHETLDRLLWRFSCENGELENPWNGEHLHWYIGYEMPKKKFYSAHVQYYKCNELYFRSQKIAQRAIDEIVKPFMKEHPDFVW